MWLWGPVVLYMAAIFVASAQPDVAIPSGTSDKWWHAVAYAALCVLVVRALVGCLPARIGITTAVLAFALTTVYGATDEIHQSFVPGRIADLQDLAADAIGAAAAAGGCWLWGIIHASRHGL
jgi:VanZ family protein